MLHRPSLCATLVSISLLTSSCGGDDPEATRLSQYEAELETARVKLAEFLALVSTSPCSSDAHCTTLTFASGRNACERPEPVDYSIISPSTATALKAAEDYDKAMNRAWELVPPTGTPVCTSTVNLLPLQCRENKCVRGITFSGR